MADIIHVDALPVYLSWIEEKSPKPGLTILVCFAFDQITFEADLDNP